MQHPEFSRLESRGLASVVADKARFGWYIYGSMLVARGCSVKKRSSSSSRRQLKQDKREKVTQLTLYPLRQCAFRRVTTNQRDTTITPQGKMTWARERAAESEKANSLYTDSSGHVDLFAFHHTGLKFRRRRLRNAVVGDAISVLSKH